MHPAPIVMADQTWKKNPRNVILILLAPSVWSALPIGVGDIGAPILTSANSLVRLAYFHTNHLLTGLYKTEMEIRWRKDKTIKKQTDINRHGPKPSSNSSQPPNPPPFSLLTTFKGTIPITFLFKIWFLLVKNFIRMNLSATYYSIKYIWYVRI